MLNVEDLAERSTLVDLYDTRVDFYPAWFRNVDCRLVQFAIWSGCLPNLRVDGQISFPLDKNRDADDQYVVVFRENLLSDCNAPAVHDWMKAGSGAVHLDVQLFTYDFLISFLLYFVESYCGQQTGDEGPLNQELSILDYYA